VSPALASNVTQLLGHRQVLLHVVQRLHNRGAEGLVHISAHRWRAIKNAPFFLIDGAQVRINGKEDLNYVFPEIKLRGLFPNFRIHTSLSFLYISWIGSPIVLQPKRQTDCGNI
jgi:hypothetical protein